jgi:hypothetical protein
MKAIQIVAAMVMMLAGFVIVVLAMGMVGQRWSIVTVCGAVMGVSGLVVLISLASTQGK